MTRPLANVSVLLLLAACSRIEPEHPTHTRLLDEGTAIAVISRVLHEQQETPAEGRNIRLSTGKLLYVDVGVSAKQLGIAYITQQDMASLDSKDLPPRAYGNDLWITQGTGPDADAVILLLDARDYALENARHRSQTAPPVSADQRLARDVRDFVLVARERKLP